MVKRLIANGRQHLLSPLVRLLAGGIFSQGLLSISNFLIGILIARQASKTEYGIFVVAFSIIMIFISVQNALVNSPLIVLLPNKKGRLKEEFLSGKAIGQWFVFLPLILVGVIIYSYFQFVSKNLPVVFVLLALLITIPAALWREFIRVVNFYNRRINIILIMDSVFVVSILSGIVLIGFRGSLSGAKAIFLIGIFYLIVGILGQILSKQHYQYNRIWIKNAFRETWKYSRWALLGGISTNLRGYGYVYIISLTLNLEHTANLSAARLLLMPFGVLINSSQRIFLTTAARILNDRGRDKFHRSQFGRFDS